MIKIIHQKDPANIQKPVAYEVEEGTNVLEWLCATFPGQQDLCGDLSCSFVLNGKEIFRSDHEELDQSILDFTISNFDRLVIVNRPAGLGVGAIIAIVSVVISVAVAVYTYYNMPDLPGSASNDSANTSPNNLLNAASNTMRTGEAIPENFGYGISFPDRAQPYYYYYEDNVKKTVALLTVGVGEYDLPEVRVGDTDINNITSSSYQIIEPYESVDQSILQIHRPTPNVDGQFLIAPDDGGIITGSITITLVVSTPSSGKRVGMGIGLDAIEDLGLYEGGYIYIRSSYVDVVTIQAFNGVFFINDITGGTVTVQDEGDSAGWDTSWYTGGVMTVSAVVGVGDSSSTVGQGFDGEIADSVGWFELTGDNDREILINWLAPSGITSDEREAITVSARMQARHEETGTVYTIDESMRLNTLDPQYRTTKFNSDTVPGFLTGQYSVRMKRLTNSLPSGYIDVLKVEAFVGVEYYTKENFGNTTNILVNRTATLTGQDQSGSKINCDYERKLPYYNRVTDEYEADNLVATNSFADAIAYTLIMKGNESESTVNLAELYDIYDGLSDPQLGEFTFTFDDANLSKGERVESIGNVARVISYHDGVQWRFARDEAKPVRSALFNRRSVVSNNASQAWQPQRSDDADSIRVYYVDPDDNIESTIERAFDTATGEILTGEVGDNVLEVKLAGCRNVYQATNRADLEIRRLAYQRRTVTETTYRDALEIDLLDRVGWVDINDLDTFDGEIMSVDGNNYETTERFEPVDGESYFVFITDDEGYPSNTVECLPRSDTEFGFYAEGLSGSYTADTINQLGSRYFITNADDLKASNFIIQSRTPASDGTVSIELVEYNADMYDGDSFLPPSAKPIIPSIEPIQISTASEGVVFIGAVIIFGKDGNLTYSNGTELDLAETYWYSIGFDESVGYKFEVFISRTEDLSATFTGSFNEWNDIELELSSTYGIRRNATYGDGVSTSVFTVSIREKANHANIATGNVTISSARSSDLLLPNSITVEDITSTNAASSSLSISSNGEWVSSTSLGASTSGSYTTIVNGIGALYECRATNLVGDLDLGTVDEWITLDGSGTLFTMNSSVSETVTFDLEIREIANTSNSDTTAVTLETSIS